ncbi:MAG: zf-TFIIB domain-containing protein, partial [Polyangiaceae bacterium]
CRGIWLDKSGTEAVVRGAISVVDDEAGAGKRGAPRSPYRGAPRVLEGRLCPFCGGRLELVSVPELGVQVDICREHGTWFDVTELNAVVEHYVDERGREEDVVGRLLRRATKPSLRARRWHPFW